MDAKPVNLTEALSSFQDIYSPRIVARMNDYDVKIAHAKGEHVWHVHDDTDEFFLVLDGRFDIVIRWGDPDVRTIRHSIDREPQRRSHPGPRGQHHRPRADQ